MQEGQRKTSTNSTRSCKPHFQKKVTQSECIFLYIFNEYKSKMICKSLHSAFISVSYNVLPFFGGGVVNKMLVPPLKTTFLSKLLL